VSKPGLSAGPSYKPEDTARSTGVLMLRVCVCLRLPGRKNLKIERRVKTVFLAGEGERPKSLPSLLSFVNTLESLFCDALLVGGDCRCPAEPSFRLAILKDTEGDGLISTTVAGSGILMFVEALALCVSSKTAQDDSVFPKGHSGTTASLWGATSYERAMATSARQAAATLFASDLRL